MYKIFVFFVFFAMPAIAQKNNFGYMKTPFQRAVELANENFSQGNYTKALNAYTFSLNLIYLSEDKKPIEEKIKAIKSIIALYTQVFDAIDKKNFSLSYSYLKKIGELNPSDKKINSLEVQIKEISSTSSVLKRNENTQFERWIATYERLKKEGKTRESISVLAFLKREYPTNPKVIFLVTNETIKKTNTLNSSAICEENKRLYDIVSKEMKTAFSDCRFNLAKEKVLKILSLECYENDNTALRMLRQINTLQADFRRISILNSGGSSSNSAYIIDIYKSLYRAIPTCVENDYFYFVFRIAERIRILNSCNKELVSYYSQLISISKELSQKEGISEKIKTIEDECNCKNKTETLRALLQQAKSSYLQCNFDDAIIKYNLATQFKCSEVDVPQLKEWQEIILPKIFSEREVTKRFMALKTSADSLVALQECSEAIQLYNEARELKSSCQGFEDLTKRIEIAECLCLNKDVNVLVDSSSRSVKLGYFFDAYRFLLMAENLGRPSNCINSLKLDDIELRKESLKCRVFPDSCKTIDYNSYGSVGLYASSFLNVPLFQGMDQEIIEGSKAIDGSVGIMVSAGSKTFGEIGFGVGYSRNFYKIFRGDKIEPEKIEFRYLNIPLYMAIRLSNKGAEKPIGKFPFIYVAGIFQVPLSFRYSFINSDILSDTKYVNSFTGLKQIGAGYSWTNWVISGFYENSGNVLNSLAYAKPIYLSGLSSNRFGVNVVFRKLYFQTMKK
jgi:hypothetical protein